MAIPHAKPGEVVNLRPLGAALATTETKTLVKTKDIEVIRLIVPAGKEIPAHKAKGEIVVQWREKWLLPPSARVRISKLGKCSTCLRVNRTASKGSRIPHFS